MIKYIKSVSFYKNGAFLESVDLEKKSFYTEDEAMDHLVKTPLKYYYSKKYYSCIESARLYIKTATGYKIKNKKIDVKNDKIIVDQ